MTRQSEREDDEEGEGTTGEEGETSTVYISQYSDSVLCTKGTKWSGSIGSICALHCQSYRLLRVILDPLNEPRESREPLA